MLTTPGLLFSLHGSLEVPSTAPQSLQAPILCLVPQALLPHCHTLVLLPLLSQDLPDAQNGTNRQVAHHHAPISSVRLL